MRSALRRTIMGFFLIVSVSLLEGCANTSMSTSVGVGMSFGPYGPSVQPIMNVGVYAGGRW